jgi:hypothetical protein
LFGYHLSDFDSIEEYMLWVLAQSGADKDKALNAGRAVRRAMNKLQGRST